MHRLALVLVLSLMAWVTSPLAQPSSQPPANPRVAQTLRDFLQDPNIKTSDDLNKALERLVKEGKITQQEAEQVKSQFADLSKLLRTLNTSALTNLSVSSDRLDRLKTFSAQTPPELNNQVLTDAMEVIATVNAANPTKEIMGKQPVLFASNRVIKEGPFTKEAFTYDRSNSVTLGEAIVSIPKAHRIGMTERPGRYFYFFKQSESEGQHFVIQELRKLTDQEFSSRISAANDSALVFVHGYNVTFEDAIYKTAQIAFDSNFDGPVLAYSWPSAGSILGYVYDNNSARASAPLLLNVLKQVKQLAPNRKIILVAHSLGSDMVVEALNQASLAGEKLNITELVLAAPDIDKDLFKSRADRIRQIAGNVTIYASSSDKALLASKEGAGAPRMGFIESGGPTLVPGIEVIDVTAVGDSMFELNHGTFSGSRAVIEDLGRIIKSSARPPHVRSPSLRRMPDSTNVQYWMYPQ